MKKFFENLKKMPLLLAILITGILLTAVAATGVLRRVYATDGYDVTKQPLLSLVFSGQHDGISPAQALFGKAPDRDGVPGDLAGTGDSAASDASAAAASEAASASAEGSSGAENAGSGLSAESADTSASAAASSSGDSSASASSAADAVSSEAASEENAIAAKKAASASYIHADTMPEGVCSEVVQATDYGNADKRYMDADGTAYNTDTTGIFAQNGDYYTLQAVDDSYFSDALFLGDSRTEGLHDYGNMKTLANFLAKDSLSVFTMWQKTLPYWMAAGTSGSDTIEGLLNKYTFRKVYLCVGINELGMPATTAYYKNYRAALEGIRKLQPDAIIYIEGMMHVSKAETTGSGVFNNTIIVQRNAAVSTMANGHDIFYIDMNSAIVDADGNVPADATNDGIHLKASYYEKWHQYLLGNGIIRSPEDNTGAAPTAK
jgi:lysophospholipase L1-like esterase